MTSSQSSTAALSPPLLPVVTTPMLNDSSYTLDSFTQDNTHPYSQSSDLMMLAELSEEVKSKPTPNKPTDFMRSYSSEASSPAMSSLSPSKDRHYSLPSYGEGSYPMSDMPQLESVSPG